MSLAVAMFGERHRIELDSWLLGAALALLLLGFVVVASASITIADRELGQPFYYLQRQLVFAAAGCIAGLVALGIPMRWWERCGVGLLLLALAGLLLVFVPGLGREVNGSVRWLRLGPLSFQVSEAARLLILLYLAGYLVRYREALQTSSAAFLKPLACVALACTLLLAEPDFGAATVLALTALGLMFVAGVRYRDFLLLAVIASFAMGGLAISSAYRVKRLTAFLDPWADPYDSGFQLTQSLIAIGRGEWLGVGLGASAQKLFYLPEAHTDFVFAVLAEELGLVGVFATLGLFAVLVSRILLLARRAAEVGQHFNAYVAFGLGLWLGLQAIINIGVNMGLLPTKGLTLPLLSYGGSSLLVTCASIGLLLRIHHEVALAGVSAKPKRRGA